MGHRPRAPSSRLGLHLAVLAVVLPRALAVAVPSVSSDGVDQIKVVNRITTFSLTFSNKGDTVGYLPFVDIVVPRGALDTVSLVNGSAVVASTPVDAISILDSATFQGTQVAPVRTTFPTEDAMPAQFQPSPAGTTCSYHPYATTGNRHKDWMCGEPHEAVYSIALPVLGLPPGGLVTYPITVNGVQLNEDLEPFQLRLRAGFIRDRTPPGSNIAPADIASVLEPAGVTRDSRDWPRTATITPQSYFFSMREVDGPGSELFEAGTARTLQVSFGVAPRFELSNMTLLLELPNALNLTGTSISGALGANTTVTEISPSVFQIEFKGSALNAAVGQSDSFVTATVGFRLALGDKASTGEANLPPDLFENSATTFVRNATLKIRSLASLTPVALSLAVDPFVTRWTMATTSSTLSEVVEDGVKGVRIGQAMLHKGALDLSKELHFDSLVGVALQPGDRATYSVKYTMPMSSSIGLQLTVWPPLPSFDVSELVPFVDAFGVAAKVDNASFVPLAGQIMVGPEDTYSNLTRELPQAEIDVQSQNIVLRVGNFTEGDGSQYSVVHLLYTLTVTNEPVEDGIQVASLTLGRELGILAAPSFTAYVAVRQPLVHVVAGVFAVKGNTPSAGALPVGLEIPTASRPQLAGEAERLAVNASGADSRGFRFADSLTPNDVFLLGRASEALNLDAGDKTSVFVGVFNSGGSQAFDIQVLCTIFDNSPSGHALASTARVAGVAQASASVVDWTTTDSTANNAFFSLGNGQTSAMGGGTIAFLSSPPDSAGSVNISLEGLSPVRAPTGLLASLAVKVATFDVLTQPFVAPAAGNTRPSFATITCRLRSYAAAAGGPNFVGADSIESNSSAALRMDAKHLLANRTDAVDSIKAHDPSPIVPGLLWLSDGDQVSLEVAIAIPEGKVEQLRVQASDVQASRGADPELSIVSVELIEAGPVVNGVQPDASVSASGVNLSASLDVLDLVNTADGIDSVADVVRFSITARKLATGAALPGTAFELLNISVSSIPESASSSVSGVVRQWTLSAAKVAAPALVLQRPFSITSPTNLQARDVS
ncbi:hypothetical protein FNF31_05714 [Cafeteria roenbergensis]|uniref:Uncharacterized protein n=1 Tax=Cafeteria roenbergensis TaxID=33653 RepID=A0A5A8CXP6_CAFRO|nr:hypothetical protein FNF31_05714 [Cafeteria roenbergensis]